MQSMKPSASLQKGYSNISVSSEGTPKRVYIKKSKYSVLAVRDKEQCERITDEIELYRLLEEGAEDIRAGRTRPFDIVMQELRMKINGEKL